MEAPQQTHDDQTPTRSIGEDENQQNQLGQMGPNSPSQFENSSNKLYVGNLSPQVTEAHIYDLFSTLGQVTQVKLIRDRVTRQSAGYGFVDYALSESATAAINSFKGMRVYGRDLDVNRAHRNTTRDHTANHFHLFVGDLGSDVDDVLLLGSFTKLGDCSDARVMWDPASHRSRGYGFVSFRNQQDAEKAIREMNGQYIGSRPVRVNWATQKQPTPQFRTNFMMMPPIQQPMVAQRTVYVGNIGSDVTQHALQMKFQEVGNVQEVRYTQDKGYAFIGYNSHEDAMRAIQLLNGQQLGSKPIKVAWGKRDGGQNQNPRFPFPQQFPFPYNYQNPYFPQMGNMGVNPNMAAFAPPSNFMPANNPPTSLSM